MGIGKNIRYLRLKNGLTQKQLGEKCGMADSAIRRYELEKANPKIETLQKIANALNVSIIDLDSRSDFTEAHLRHELQTLRKKELNELNQIPNDEWFGKEWHEIHQKYETQKKEIQKKLDNLPQAQKEKDEKLFLTGPGKRIKKLREKKGMSQQTLASLTDIPLSLIRKYEDQQRTPTDEHIFQLAKVFHVPTIDISLFSVERTVSSIEEDIMYNKLITTYNFLNKEGQKKVLEQIEMISKIPDYLENED